MRFYPVGVNIKNKKVIVVGGGKVAERKVKSLLPYNAKIIVVSPELTNNLRKLVEKNKIKYVKGKYTSSCIKNAFLVFACTSDNIVNKKIFMDAKKKKIMCNVCDKTELCDFIVPAVMNKKGLIITVSSDGRNPKLSKRFKEIIKNEFGSLWNRL